MPNKKPLNAKRARELFSYEPETGILRRKIALGRAKVGIPVGYLSPSGYLKVSADCWPYLVHRIIWLIVKGRWPDQTDHADLNRSNNRWSNLREATTSQNMANRGKRARNTSGYKGVTFHAETGKWRARIYYNGKHHEAGLFDRAKDAGAAYAAIAKKIHGEFART